MLQSRYVKFCRNSEECPCSEDNAKVTNNSCSSAVTLKNLAQEPEPDSYQVTHEASGKNLILISKSPFVFQFWKNWFIYPGCYISSGISLMKLNTVT